MSHDAASRGFRFDLPCQVVRERDFVLVGEHIVALNTDGVAVTTAQDLDDGEALLVSLRLPEGRWVDAQARVDRLGQPEVAGPRLAGSTWLSFEGLDSEARESLCDTALNRLLADLCMS